MARGDPRRERRASNGRDAIAMAIILVVALAVVSLPHAGADEPVREEIRVTFVPDGDTVRCRWRGREEWVRLLRINTPERERPGWAAAREHLLRALDGRLVFLEFERPGVPERDRYGRLLGYLYAGGKNCNVEIVRAGDSRFWTKYGAGRHAEEFRAAEAEARGARRGLWKRGRLR